MANLTSVESYFDFFSDKVDCEVMELEEAEIELDILQKEHAPQQSCKDSKISPAKDDSRLLQIKESIRSIEKSKLQEDIAVRRQRKLVLRHTRQKDLEDAAFREAELLQDLDRERAVEAEKEIERQRLLELERAKTRELRHNLEIEKEKQTQRELQRELEQAESGVRQSRRDFSSSTHTGRARDRYRERENGRPERNEGSTRTSVETSNNTASPAVLLSGSRSFTGQLPTILQSRERIDECGSSYDENLDGGKESWDTGSVGDPDLASAFDGASGQRHGSRGGGKSRQVVERRERDGGRREGKWERKH